MTREKKTDPMAFSMFIAGNILLLIGVILWIWFIRHVDQYDWGCSIYRMTGFYCPGCGGTRAVNALLHGRLWQSFLYHPAVPYSAIVFGVFMLSWYIELITRHRLRCGLKFRPVFIYIGLGILILQWILKNLFRI